MCGGLQCRGYNIGQRIIDEFLAKSGVNRCADFKDSCDTLAQVPNSPSPSVLSQNQYLCHHVGGTPDVPQRQGRHPPRKLEPQPGAP